MPPELIDKIDSLKGESESRSEAVRRLIRTSDSIPESEDGTDER